ncbi:MAG: hypothetical protein LBS52_01295 [Dysgonamonadaceae bacterium]|jgi:hypothetical protein|nr:hypothetical protein [Dysgonamonadaceae bacterium]
MKHIKTLVAGLLFMTLASFSLDKLPETFTDLLNRANLTFQQTAGFEEVKTIENKQMNYEYAIKHLQKNFEIRYAIRPLDERIQQYEEREKNKKEGDVNFHPNQLYLGTLQAIIFNISGGKFSANIQTFDKQAVKEEFNADWGAMTMVEVGKEFGQEYKYCMVVAIHKDDFADAYFFYLSDTKDGFEELLTSAFHSLKFK